MGRPGAHPLCASSSSPIKWKSWPTSKRQGHAATLGGGLELAHFTDEVKSLDLARMQSRVRELSLSI